MKNLFISVHKLSKCPVTPFRFGFTLGELTITLIVITMVVVITMPITFNKLKNVDYVSYYTGYEAVKNIAISTLPGLIVEPEIPDNPDVGVDPVVPDEFLMDLVCMLQYIIHRV